MNGTSLYRCIVIAVLLVIAWNTHPAKPKQTQAASMPTECTKMIMFGIPDDGKRLTECAAALMSQNRR